MYRRYRPYRNMFSPHQWRVLHSSPDWKMKLTRENSTVTATFIPRFSLNKDYSFEIEDVRNYDDLCKKVREWLRRDEEQSDRLCRCTEHRVL